MKRLLIICAVVLSLVSLPGGGGGEVFAQKGHKKEIPASNLPNSITSYISANLPNAKITKVTKQRRSPDAAYIINVTIKTKKHTLVFNKHNELVRLDGKKLESTRLK